MNAPIVLFVYNRPYHTRMTVEALQKNKLASESELFIYSDGVKDTQNYQRVQDVRDYIRTIDGFKTVKIIEREKNLGLANSIIDGVTTIVNQYGSIIVLEDDLVTSPYFLQYMNDALNIYEYNSSVISIHGYVYPIQDELQETFFIKGADCWGWATWERGWGGFEEDGSKLLRNIIDCRRQKEFNFGNSINYLKMLEDQVKGKNDSWAVRWYASAFINDLLTLYPGKSMINNIGNDSSGTHCKDSNIFKTELANSSIAIKKKLVVEDLASRYAFEKYFRSVSPKFISKVIHKLKMLV